MPPPSSFSPQRTPPGLVARVPLERERAKRGCPKCGDSLSPRPELDYLVCRRHGPFPRVELERGTFG